MQSVHIDIYVTSNSFIGEEYYSKTMFELIDTEIVEDISPYAFL